ncbi:hypothetical protein M2451_001567 [Dysgonomonas sp. PFB1-18]|uniref:DUF4249 domain-containing protein n=1 Tax=unclassified Dysgonomonas TaxID=2630389 RepID=UPI002475643C|nr:MULTISPECIES: DUF4249 domain-containing protein [unclassified Dysgonomonas]MDL2303517.1 DUF4249 domain-containing protein [Dysgonomonas sp. OttesenSCG-928-D17]MDH6308975.1 hypothetical protein [Dysgonomonas sp. PF1-14]MDH6338726.1 hypothetical protein [Dysgonomonas sp. PF1-16]MDH6380246.1 hypothetical protein [Dysgonomonas sp. PFB1-18]MDH6397576.1 hypothetical protein [Dysgonomonas sp. PF1-23]
MRFIYSLLFIFLISATSCEEVVTLDLNTVDPMNVVDAFITEGSPCVVLLTKSQAFYSSEPFEHIPGATIELRSSGGESEILQESINEPGLYLSSMFGVVGETYYIKISTGDDIYEASATIPEAVPINEVYIYEIKAGDKSWFSPSIVFDDPPGVTNYYYTLLYVNDKLMSSFYLNDDENRDGLQTHRILFFDKEDNDDEDLNAGDRLRVEMQSLDVGMYTFYKSLRSVAEGSNPTTNLSGGALGCFKAYNTSYGSAVVSSDIIYNGEK